MESQGGAAKRTNLFVYDYVANITEMCLLIFSSESPVGATLESVVRGRPCFLPFHRGPVHSPIGSLLLKRSTDGSSLSLYQSLGRPYLLSSSVHFVLHF